MRDHGQVVPLAAALGVVASVLALGVARLGERRVVREQVRQAVDAAALAGAVGGRSAAAQAAHANGAELMAFFAVQVPVVGGGSVPGVEAMACREQVCAVARARA